MDQQLSFCLENNQSASIWIKQDLKKKVLKIFLGPVLDNWKFYFSFCLIAMIT